MGLKNSFGVKPLNTIATELHTALKALDDQAKTYKDKITNAETDELRQKNLKKYAKAHGYAQKKWRKFNNERRVKRARRVRHTHKQPKKKLEKRDLGVQSKFELGEMKSKDENPKDFAEIDDVEAS